MYMRYNTLTLSGGQMLGFKLTIPHARFDEATLTNDIGLGETYYPMVLGVPNAQKIKLPPTQKMISGINVNISGWGSTDPRSPVFSQDLQIAELTTIGEEECRAKHREAGSEAKIFCARSEHGEVCSTSGDRGGPGVMNKVLFGVLITRFKVGCEDEDNAEIFTDVGQYVDWIKLFIPPDY
ncbi:hypothetical protein RDWZM_010004 [Blomia tropicalis]|uniref:Peptidase S1 domain-containing protein n=1 Tax=Blomia tropicalis TaxID=40697 RepID=A0A9Q0LXY0_BLOTA|nr:hypothetical protein RDWZM_010004 [Blomia tropicalis]